MGPYPFRIPNFGLVVLMTYNFDVDRWFENQKALLEARLAKGELDEAAYHAAVEDLDRRAEEMLGRLDGTFQGPGFTPRGDSGG